jgi:DNA-binding LacI/PurR family transcriptional regulator
MPGLTTIRQPLELMGRQATKLLMEMINEKEIKPGKVELPTQLILRGSCKEIEPDTTTI